VDAAKEISQLDSEERSVFPDSTFFDGKVVTKTKTIGADDFLPIFIFCFVQAKIERPSALCKLNQSIFIFFYGMTELNTQLVLGPLPIICSTLGELLTVMCDPAKMNGEVRIFDNVLFTLCCYVCTLTIGMTVTMLSDNPGWLLFGNVSCCSNSHS